MAPPDKAKATKPSAQLEELINKSFGSMDEMKAAFEARAAPGALFGSGWVWICVNQKGDELKLVGTPNQVCAAGTIPLFLNNYFTFSRKCRICWITGQPFDERSFGWNYVPYPWTRCLGKLGNTMTPVASDVLSNHCVRMLWCPKGTCLLPQVPKSVSQVWTVAQQTVVPRAMHKFANLLCSDNQTSRPEYVSNFWNVVNWDKVSENCAYVIENHAGVNVKG